MARAYNVEVLNQTVGTTAAYSGGQYYETLGRADEVAVQVIVDAVSTTLNVTAVLEHSNDGANATFTTVTGTSTTESSISAATSFWLTAPSIKLGAFLRVKVNTSTGTASIRVAICGRVLG